MPILLTSSKYHIVCSVLYPLYAKIHTEDHVNEYEIKGKKSLLNSKVVLFEKTYLFHTRMANSSGT